MNRPKWQFQTELWSQVFRRVYLSPRPLHSKSELFVSFPIPIAHSRIIIIILTNNNNRQLSIILSLTNNKAKLCAHVSVRSQSPHHTSNWIQSNEWTKCDVDCSDKKKKTHTIRVSNGDNRSKKKNEMSAAEDKKDTETTQWILEQHRQQQHHSPHPQTHTHSARTRPVWDKGRNDLPCNEYVFKYYYASLQALMPSAEESSHASTLPRCDAYGFRSHMWQPNARQELQLPFLFAIYVLYLESETFLRLCVVSLCISSSIHLFVLPFASNWMLLSEPN